jgi:hypothetical protein
MRLPVAVPALAVLLAACAGAADPPTTSSSPSPPAPATATTGNGNVFVTTVDGDTATVTSRAIAEDGSLGQTRTVVAATVSDSTSLTALDGLGDLALIGEFTDYWTTSAALRRGADLLSEVPADKWCGGEGLTYGICVLLDEARAAHTTELGYEADSGAGSPTGSVVVVSLADGTTIDEFGPFPGLGFLFGTPTSGEVILVSGGGIDEVVPSTVSRLDLTDGSTESIGTSEPGWGAVCPLSDDAVLGVATTGPRTLSVVGAGTVAPIVLDDADTPKGCSTDGRFLYLERPGEESGSLVRVTLDSGEADAVLDLGTGGALVTR